LSFDGAQRAGREILATVNRHHGHASSATHDEVGAFLPHLLATKRPQDAEKVLRSHRNSIGMATLPV
jgi:hypothetical protein